MPEFLNAFIYVAMIFAVSCIFNYRPMQTVVGDRRAKLWMVVWLMITAAMFLTRNVWLFLAVSSLMLFIAARSDRSPVALYVLAIPIVYAPTLVVPGFAGIESLFHVTPIDFYAATLLVPLMFSRDFTASGTALKSGPFFWLCMYLGLSVVLATRDANATTILRMAVGLFLSALLPFMVVVKTVNTKEKIENVLAAFVFALVPMGAIGAFESLKHWRLYTSATSAWGESLLGSSYLERAGSLRATGPLAGPIVFGFVFMIALGLFLGLASRIPSWWQRLIVIGALGLGIISSLSRGPWVGAVAIVLIFILTGRNALSNLTKLVVLAVIFLGMASMTQFGSRIIDTLPFVGISETENVDYRADLFDNALIVILRHPLFGSDDYLETPEMQDMIQGQGIIDIVNSYVQIALKAGLVGLAIYLLFFFTVLLGLWSAIRQVPDTEVDLKTLGRALLATLCGALLTIATVSNIGQIPYLLWLLTGLSTAYCAIVRGDGRQLGLSVSDLTLSRFERSGNRSEKSMTPKETLSSPKARLK